jgi:hypothetical protein
VAVASSIGHFSDLPHEWIRLSPSLGGERGGTGIVDVTATRISQRAEQLVKLRAQQLLCVIVGVAALSVTAEN